MQIYTWITLIPVAHWCNTVVQKLSCKMLIIDSLITKVFVSYAISTYSYHPAMKGGQFVMTGQLLHNSEEIMLQTR